jgi:DNA-binding CsgD family transcriptional regulator
MRHLIILANVLIFTTGFAVLYQGISLYRTYRFPAVRSFLIFVAVANLMDLISLLMQYIARNVTSLTSDERYLVVFVIMGFIGFSLAAMEIAFFGSTVWHLSGMTRAPRWCVYTYASICSLWVCAFSIGASRFFLSGDRYFLRGVLEASTSAVAAFFAILALILLFNSRTMQPDRHRRLVRMFGLFFIVPTFMDICLLFLPTEWSDLLLTLTDLAMSLGLLACLKPFVVNYYGPLAPIAGINHCLDRVCTEFSLSARERDLLQMILKGKSNKEIEHELFISPHTVKNHIYHIFQKTGINSRGQLVSMVMQNSAALADGQES